MSPLPVVRPALRGSCGVLLLVFLALPAVAGELYQWKDSQGVTHYADSPPAGQSFKSRTIRSDNASAAQAKPATAESSQCTTARINLEHLTGTRPMGFDADGDGKADSALDATQRAEQKQLAEKTVARECAAAANLTEDKT